MGLEKSSERQRGRELRFAERLVNCSRWLGLRPRNFSSYSVVLVLGTDSNPVRLNGATRGLSLIKICIGWRITAWSRGLLQIVFIQKDKSISISLSTPRLRSNFMCPTMC